MPWQGHVLWVICLNSVDVIPGLSRETRKGSLNGEAVQRMSDSALSSRKTLLTSKKRKTLRVEWPTHTTTRLEDGSVDDHKRRLPMLSVILMLSLLFQVIRSSMDLVCKCHGVSGACTIRVCWRKMKPFRSIGDALTRKFDSATHVKVIEGRNRIKMRPTRRDVKKPGRKDLIFLDDSPDFCVRNETTGVMGTTGRVCNATSYGMDGCRILCCGRGYQTIVKTIEEKVMSFWLEKLQTNRRFLSFQCNCKFVWCCNVKCEMCVKKIEMTTCNWDFVMTNATASLQLNKSTNNWMSVQNHTLYSSQNANLWLCNHFTMFVVQRLNRINTTEFSSILHHNQSNQIRNLL